MAYCSEADLKARFGDTEIDDLLDRDNDSSADTNALASAQTDTDAQIDGYLAARYSTPLTTVPDLVVGIACNICRYILWGNNAPEEVRRRFEDSRTQLRDIAKGTITLPTDEITPMTNGGGVSFVDTYDDRVFTMSTLSDF